MTRILVTGGRTGLGREVVDLLRRAEHQVRVLSRKPKPVEVDATVAARKLLADVPLAPPLEWAQVNLGNGQGLAAALKGVDVVIHAASSPMQRPTRASPHRALPLLTGSQRAKYRRR